MGILENDDGHGTCVCVTQAIGASAQQIWAALTEPEHVGRWLGEISGRLSESEMVRWDQGCGDFSVLEVTRSDPPRELQYVSRPLGIGPKEAISWRITPRGRGCLVTVTDREPRRTREAAIVLRKDWLERTGRLEQLVRGGRPGDHPQIPDFRASTELPGDLPTLWDRLLGPASQTAWFPFSGPLSETGLTFDVKGDEPAQFRVVDVDLDQPGYTLSFRLAHENWLSPTDCHLGLRQRPQGVMLDIDHQGWEAISFDPEDRRRQRTWFAVLWLRILLRITLGYVRSLGLASISPGELRSRIGSPNFYVLDSNRETLWRGGHIPEATSVGQEDLRPDLLPEDKDATLVFYCRDSL